MAILTKAQLAAALNAGLTTGGALTAAEDRTLRQNLYDSMAALLGDNAFVGNVGIGTAPSSSLHVKSISLVATDFALKVESSDGTAIMYSRNNGNTILYGGGFQAITIDTGSNFTSHNYSYLKDGVALGTATPTSNTLRVPNTWNVGFGSLDSGSMVKIDGASFTNALSVVGGGATSATFGLKIHNSTGTNNALIVADDGNVGIGTASMGASSILEITSTSKGVVFPRMTTTQRNSIASPVNGMVIYNTTLAKLNVYTTAWETVNSL